VGRFTPQMRRCVARRNACYFENGASHGGRKHVFKIMKWGCLTLVVVLGAGGFLAWRWWQTEGKARVEVELRKGVDQVLDDSGLSKDDKGKLRARLDRAINDFKAGRIELADLGNLMKELADGPLLAAAAVQSTLEEQLNSPTGAFPDEKQRAEARRTVERFIRALMEKSVDAGKVEEALASLREADGKGGTRLKEKPSAADVEAAVGRMKKAADEAKVPDQPYHVDFVAEVTKVIDRVLEKQPKK
jgi:hypothetical protein